VGSSGGRGLVPGGTPVLATVCSRDEVDPARALVRNFDHPVGALAVTGRQLVLQAFIAVPVLDPTHLRLALEHVPHEAAQICHMLEAAPLEPRSVLSEYAE
jgi:hypothetical protein